jgi:hypothetical protein
MKQSGNNGNGLRGLRVVRPSLYVWDADPREALRLAAELGVRHPHAPRSARRRAPGRVVGSPQN